MAKGVKLILAALIIIGGSVFGQAQDKERMSGEYVPLSVVHRLSYENFRDIKLLHTAIINYGGGEEEFDKLVEEYAEAVSLYFRNEYEPSAKKFKENEKNILEVAKRIAEKYKQDTEKIQNEVIKIKTKAALKIALAKKDYRMHPAIDAAVTDGSYTLAKANDFNVRTRPIDAIAYYRRAKERYFKVFSIFEAQLRELSDRSTKRSDVKFYEREANKYRLPEKYNRDLADNQNSVYQGGEGGKSDRSEEHTSELQSH